VPGIESAAALFGGTAPYVSTWLAATTHSPLPPGFYLLAAAAAGTLAAIFGLWHRDARPTTPSQITSHLRQPAAGNHRSIEAGEDQRD
jgi:MHS family proline/betaine transporter-like MFS transporter